MTTQRKLEIWTDGACKNNPGVGGWGAYLVWGSHKAELYDGEMLTTNNRMELSAVIAALKIINRPCPIIIHTDSVYVKDGITKWIHSWKAKGQLAPGSTKVKNVELWIELDRLASKFDIEWKWVKGHNGDPGNEKADELANKGVLAAKGEIPAKLKP